MTRPDYQRVASVIAAILARMVLTQPDPTEDEENAADADHRLRESFD